MSESGYQGWSNYPTWCVNLWLSNDESLYMEARMMAGVAKPQYENDASYRLSMTFKDWVTDDLAPDIGASFASDLFGYALDEVDWLEIAEFWLEDCE